MKKQLTVLLPDSESKCMLVQGFYFDLEGEALGFLDLNGVWIEKNPPPSGS